MEYPTLVSVEDVEAVCEEEFAKFVATAPYHTEMSLRSALRGAIKTAIKQIDPMPFLSANPDAGDWWAADRFEEDKTAFGVLRSAVGELLWNKHLEDLVELNRGMLQENLQIVVLALLRDVGNEMFWDDSSIISLKKTMKSLISEVEQANVSAGNLDRIIKALWEGNEWVQVQALAEKKDNLYRRMGDLMDRVGDLSRKRDQLMEWMSTGVSLTR